MTPAKEIDGELWVKAVDAYHMSDLAHEAGKAVGAATEREACAKVVEDCPWPKGAEHPYDTREVFSAAIRARGQA